MLKDPSARHATRFWLTAATLAAVKLLLHLLTATHYELHRDEMLYFNMADHPALGFATIPPFTGFIAFLVKAVSGYSVFSLRLVPALTGAAIILLMARIIRDLRGDTFALVLAAGSYILAGGFLITGTLFTPNIFEQFFWLLLTWMILRMVQRQAPGMWIPLGLVAGLAFLNKYSVLIFAAGFLAALAFSRQRRLFRSWHFGAAILLCLLLMLPNLIWQHQHGWPVTGHMQELRETQLVNMSYAGFFSDLFSLSGITLVVWVAGLTGLLLSPDTRTIRCTGTGSLLVLLLVLFSHGKAYYILGIIPFLLAAGGVAIGHYFRDRFSWVKPVLIALIVVIALPSVPFGLPLLPFAKLEQYHHRVGKFAVYPFSRWEDGKTRAISQVYADMTGWKELARHVAVAWYGLPVDERGKCTIYGVRNYGYAGAVHLYGKSWNLPDAITFLDSYTLWAPDTIPSGPMIVINRETDDLTEMFSEVSVAGTVRDPWFREQGLKVFLCRKPKVDIPAIYRAKAIEEKAKYGLFPGKKPRPGG